ncbi:MAG: hypothetical protein AB7K09_18490 [Planctomycetota bacterium]
MIARLLPLTALMMIFAVPAVASAQPGPANGASASASHADDNVDEATRRYRDDYPPGYTGLVYWYGPDPDLFDSGLDKTPWKFDYLNPLFSTQAQPTRGGRPVAAPEPRPEFTLRPWTLFALNYFDRPPTGGGYDDIGYTIELGFEFGLPTFGRSGSRLMATIVAAFGWQGYHEPGPNPTSLHTALMLLLGYQYSFHDNDALQFGGFYRTDLAFDALTFSNGTSAFGNAGVMGNMLGGFIRYIFRAGDFILPIGIFGGFDLHSGGREAMVGVDLGGLIGLIIIAILTAADRSFHHGVHIYID